MSDLERIVSCYNTMKAIDATDEAGKIKAKFVLENLLLSTNDLSVIDFQYDCLGDTTDKWAYLTCRAAFTKRSNIEPYLLTKFASECDNHKKADVIHILGRIRSNKALALALENVDSNDTYLREVCLYVIGWTGQLNEINLLSKHLTSESTQKLKITAGSALRQIAWRITDSKNEILKVLKQAFYQENDRLVIARIIELISSITVKNLGLREDKENPDELLGDVDKAIIRAKIFLESI